MSLLLDTHVLIWATRWPERIGPAARQVIERDMVVVASKASVFEVAVKYRTGKLDVSPELLAEAIAESSFLELDIETRHLVEFPKIRLPHADPFDLLLVAQAQTDSLTLLTADRKILAGFEGALDASR